MQGSEPLFALSLVPYLAFLWFLSRTPGVPRLALIGFSFTLVFVGVTIPIGIYCKTVLHQALSNVDTLHGLAESLLTVANILVVLGFKNALDKKTQPPAA
jgi:Protein of unknown function (DUF3593)